MVNQLIPVAKRFVTMLAFKRFGSPVFFSLMVLQVAFVPKAFITMGARKGFKIGVNPTVFLQPSAVHKLLSTIRTLVILDFVMLAFDMSV